MIPLVMIVDDVLPKRIRAFGLEWCTECYERIQPVNGSLGFSLRTAPEQPHDVHVDLTGIWGDPDAVIAAVRDALVTAGIDPDDFLEAAQPAVDDTWCVSTVRFVEPRPVPKLGPLEIDHRSAA